MYPELQMINQPDPKVPIKIFVKSLGAINEVLDKSGYFVEDETTVLELIHIINSGTGGNEFLKALLDITERELLPCIHIFINNENINTMHGLNTKLKNKDDLFILRSDMAGG